MGIGSFFKHLGEEIYKGLLFIFGQQAVEDVEAKLKSILKGDVLTIFQDGLAFAASLAVSDVDKRNAAFAKIKTDLEAAGKGLPDQLINLGIELVLSLVKSKAAVATV